MNADICVLDEELITQTNGHNLLKTEEHDEVKEEMDLNESFDLGDDIEIQEVLFCVVCI